MREIRRPANLDFVVKRLAIERHSLTGVSIFPTIREVLCFAAMLGFQIGRRLRVPADNTAIGLDGRLFAEHPDTMDTVYLIALASARDMAVLKEDHEEQVLTTFEEYAAGGLAELDSWLRETPSDTDGDTAIFNALRRNGFLTEPVPVESDLGNVDF